MNDPQFEQDPNGPPHNPYFPPGSTYPLPYEPPASPLAITSLVFGILGWTAFFFFGSIVGAITGHMALGEMRRSPGHIGGRGLAKVGLVLSYLNIVLCAVLLFIFLAVLALITAAAVDRPAMPAPVAHPTIGESGDRTERKVATLIAAMTGTPADQIDSTDLLESDLDIEDTDRIDLIVKIEHGFRIKLKPGESQSWKTVGDVVRSVRNGLQPSAKTKRRDAIEPPPPAEPATSAPLP